MRKECVAVDVAVDAAVAARGGSVLVEEITGAETGVTIGTRAPMRGVGHIGKVLMMVIE